MAERTWRFVHAADLHLERPVAGLAEVPDHLRTRLVEAPFEAARRLFDTAIAERVSLVVLSGDVVDPRIGGPRALAFLLDQFERLASRDVDVYWCAGSIDPPKAWPEAVALPPNVYRLAAGRHDRFVRDGDDAPPVCVVGRERAEPRARGKGKTKSARRGAGPIGGGDFPADAEGRYTVGVAHGTFDPETIGAVEVDYVALGGGHARSSIATAPAVVHDPGTAQGRNWDETGPHGATLVEIDDEGRARTRLVPTDAVRLVRETVAIDADTTRARLEERIADRSIALRESAAGREVLVRWRITGEGPLLARLRGDGPSTALLAELRRREVEEDGDVWSAGLGVDTGSGVAVEWYDEDSIRGDFLRLVAQYEADDALPLDVTSYIARSPIAERVGPALALDAADVRRGVLAHAAALGAARLSGPASAHGAAGPTAAPEPAGLPDRTSLPELLGADESVAPWEENPT